MSPSLDHPISPWSEGKSGLHAWVSYISALPTHLVHRFRTGGIRFLIQFILANLAFVVCFRVLTADPGQRYRAVFPWSTWSNDEAGVEGSLRIVAFGGQDILGSGAVEGRRTWLETLCEELECTELVSLVPDHRAERSIAFKDLYEEEVNTLQKDSEEADFEEAPAADYLWFKDQYPVPTNSPGLTQQMDSFLAGKAPEQAPRQTLWVFTFGYWEIWNLSAMPLKSAAESIEKIIDRLIEQLEFLNYRSINPDSIAFSDFWFNATDSQIKRLSASDAADKVDARRLESFRVLIPQLFDLSLAPGWQERAVPNYPHTRSEQMRNAAVLTKLWNTQVKEKVKEWEEMKGAKPAVVEKEGGRLEMKPKPKSEDDDDEEKKVKRSIEEGKEKRDGEEGRRMSKRDVIYAPYPRRMALITRFPKQILASMTEEEMHRANVVDSAGHGDWLLNNTMRFTDVWNPCLGGKVEGADEDEVAMCNSPDDHLFYDLFTVNQRASDEIARRVAGEVVEKMFRREKGRV